MENENIEYKSIFTKDTKKEAVAFLNSTGGTIYVGIDDTGKALGISNIDQVMLQVANSFRDGIKPDPTTFFKITPSKRDNKDIIEINIESGSFKPYYLSDNGLKPSGVYIRVGSASVPASDSHIRQLIKESDGEKYIEGLSINQELTFVTIANRFQEKNIAFGLNEKKTLGLIRSDDRFSNLALLLSEQCEHSIKVAIFEGKSKAIFKDRKEFTGSLLSQIDNVMDYLTVYNRVSSTFEGLMRKDNYDYPPTAIREALLNAIIHREYALSGSILVNLYDNRLEIVSLGGLVSGLTKADILNGISQTRNEKLANIFYRLKYVEAYGTGIPRIFELYKNSRKVPDIQILDGSVSITLPNMQYVENEKIIKNSITSPNFNNTEKLIIKLIETNKYVTKEIVAKNANIGQSRAYKILTNLCERKILKREKQGKKYIYTF